jgi:molecular chaperone Hsp33
MVNEMRWNHEFGVLETLTLGHAYLAVALMSPGFKGNDRLCLQIECSGPIKGLSVEVNAFGEVRGSLKKSPITIQSPLENLNLSPFFGAGFLSVSKYLEKSRYPFTGKIVMEHGSIAKDLALFYQKSEQIGTAIALSIFFNAEGEVSGAAGLLLQALPGAGEKMVLKLEEEMNKLPSIGKRVNDTEFPRSFLQSCFGQFEPRIIDQRGIEFMCHCNQQRIVTMLKMLDRDDLRDMATNGPSPVAIRCHHCNTSYQLSQAELQSIYNQRFPQI